MSIKIYRPLSGRIQVSGMPAPSRSEPSNREWFKDETGKAIRPMWIAGPKGWDGHWEIARQHFLPVARSLAVRFGRVDIVMDFNDHECCDRRCRNAKGDECTCTCMGVHHRGGVYSDWVDVGETTLIRSAGVKRSTSALTRAMAGRSF